MPAPHPRSVPLRGFFRSTRPKIGNGGKIFAEKYFFERRIAAGFAGIDRKCRDYQICRRKNF